MQPNTFFITETKKAYLMILTQNCNDGMNKAWINKEVFNAPSMASQNLKVR